MATDRNGHQDGGEASMSPLRSALRSKNLAPSMTSPYSVSLLEH